MRRGEPPPTRPARAGSWSCPTGRPIRYQGRVDLLAGDERDRYWVVAHRLVDRFLAAEALDMVDPGLQLYPSPAPEHCGACRFVAPCLAMEQGGDVGAALAAGFRDRGPERIEPGRLGAGAWSTGRGAAPPRFGPG